MVLGNEVRMTQRSAAHDDCWSWYISSSSSKTQLIVVWIAWNASSESRRSLLDVSTQRKKSHAIHFHYYHFHLLSQYSQWTSEL